MNFNTLNRGFLKLSFDTDLSTEPCLYRHTQVRRAMTV